MDNAKQEEVAAKAALAKKREAAMAARIEQDRRDVPPGIETTDARPKSVFADANAAFVKAQSEFGTISFDKENPHFHAKYASLSAVLKATLPALNKNGIVLLSRTDVDDDLITVDTWLMHGGLIFVRSSWPVGKVGTPPQQLGSALTYARRYTIQSVLGVAAEDDDDSNAATDAKPQQSDNPF